MARLIVVLLSFLGMLAAARAGHGTEPMRAEAGGPAVDGANAADGQKLKSVGRSIELYRRRPGSEPAFPRKKQVLDRKVIELSSLELQTVELKDPQYGEKRSWRGVPLRRLVLSYKEAKKTDLVLFHFAGGMVVPWPRTKAALAELDAWVVVAYRRGVGPWIKDLHPAPRQDNFFQDPRPIRFGQNKVVSESGKTPALKKASFRPFRYTDTLVGIEFVQRSAWERQFGVEDAQHVPFAKIERGQKLFLQRCVYCHGVRDVGGDFGPDFARPIAVTDYRRTKDIWAKVKVHRMDAWATGLAMPPQKDVRDDEVLALVAYLKAVGAEKEETPPYTPAGG